MNPNAQLSPDLLRDRAFFRLLGGNLDGAIANLEEASLMAPGEAAVLSDLSALYCERARSRSRPEDYVTALDMAERAVATHPDLSEAVFNRALALERVFLYEPARAGWRRYLEIDRSSPWAAEARVHLQKISSSGARQRKEAKRTAIQNRLADTLQALGQPSQAWRYRYLCLAWTSRLPAGQQPHTVFEIFEGAARDALKQRRPEAALDFQSQAIVVAESLDRPVDIVVSRLTSSRIKTALGRQEEARLDFGQALRALERVPLKARERLAAHFDVARQELEASEDRVAALASDLLASEHFGAQATFEFQRGDTAAAGSAIDRSLDELERRRSLVTEGAYRVSFFDQGWPAYERALALQLHLGQPENALEVLERFRARTLLGQVGEAGGDVNAAPLEWRDLCRRLPVKTTVVVYAVVEGRLITWLVRPVGVRLSPRQTDWATISALMRRLGKLQRLQKPPGTTELLERLHTELVTPWQRELHGSDRIIFVPTRDLYRVPFAALIDPASGRFLIQDHAVGIAPSTSEFLAAFERDRKLSARPLARLLLVGDPSFNRAVRPELPELQGSKQELQLLSSLYQGVDIRVLTKARATRENVLTALARADIVHFATHALEDHSDPGRSGLVLAPSESDPGELSAHDLVGLRLLQTRLVALASCGSNSGPMSESEGSLSLAHSFLAAGVPAVLGSLWQISDMGTFRLSARFHQELLRGADAVSALRAAQLAEIGRGTLADWTWASLQVFGGVEAREPSASAVVAEDGVQLGERSRARQAIE